VVAFAAGEDAHRCWPAGELVPGPAGSQRRCQLGDVSFLDPAAATAAASIGAGVIGGALTYLAVGADGDQPGVWGNLADRGALAFAQRQPTG
jgi:hypothetical protein